MRCTQGRVSVMVAWLVFYSQAVTGHVPAYDTQCTNGCCTPQHTHTTSQVYYLQTDLHDRGGLEVHIHNAKIPFDQSGGELIDVDAVFRDPIDPSTVRLTIGCGGCARGDIYFSEEPWPLELQPPEFEPFSQTAIRSGWRGKLGDASKKFPSARLANCDHFTIRLDVFANASGPVIWGAVIGKDERFTAAELASFGFYQIANHGSEWTDAGFTLFLNLVLAIALIATTKLVAFHGYGGDAMARALVLDSSGVVRYACNFREVCYDAAIHAYTLSLLELLTHFTFCISVEGLEMSAFSFWVFWTVIFGVCNVLPLILILVIWGFMYVQDKRGCFVRADIWAPIELLLAVLFLYSLGSGLFFGPLVWGVGALARLRETEWVGRWMRTPVHLSPIAAARLEEDEKQKRDCEERSALVVLRHPHSLRV